MIFYPAIDILEGQVVRLVQGDFGQKTVFSDDPRHMLRAFQDSGATHLHLVDLSGARDPANRQGPLLEALLSQTSLRAQVGGGIRTLEEIKKLFQWGADRAVLGSLVVTEPSLALEALSTFGPQRLTFALDVQLKDGRAIVMSHGWKKSSGRSFEQVIEPYARKGLKRVLCTDIAVDGLMSGPNLELYRTLTKKFPDLEIQASGGVAGLDDLTELKETGVHSVVVGRALFSGVFGLKEALSHVE